jgi:hypothetical protein
MPVDYQQEPRLITASKIKDYRGRAMEDQSAFESAKITIYKADFSDIDDPVLPEQTMTWDDDYFDWMYEWDTTEVDAGTYKAKIVLTVDGKPSIEYKRIRVKRDPTKPE